MNMDRVFADPETYWNDEAHPKAPMIYAASCVPKHKTPIGCDVRRFVSAPDAVVDEALRFDVVSGNEWIGNLDLDERVQAIQKWVVSGTHRFGDRKGKPVLTYVSDSKAQGYPECWLHPHETLALGMGDCDDGSFLIASLMLAADVPAWRVRVATGWVKSGNTSGGHAYCCYCRPKDNMWVAIDWCFLEDSSIAVNDKPLIRDRPEYGEVWFSTNHLYTWVHTQFALKKGKVKDYEENDVPVAR